MASGEVPNWGYFIPTTTIFDADLVNDVDVTSDEFKELIIQLYQTVNNISLLANAKTTGYYLKQEFNTSELLFSVNNDFNTLRTVYCTTVNFGSLPAAGTKSVAHGISNIDMNYSPLIISCAAVKPSPVSWIPIPYVSATALANNLEINVDATNVNITTGGTDYSAYTRTLVILKYVKY